VVPEPSIPVDEAARFLDVPEGEAQSLAGADGKVPLETVRSRAGAAAIAGELARAREEAGRLGGQLKEVRATNVRLQRELKDSIEERRRLTAEVLELRAAAEERLMLMERIEHIARVEQDLEESSSELERLKNRRLLARIVNR
jgi:predicted RNase H-like nuclease (RuvC/YqgF family)